jgi:hypothetical protein
MTTIIYPTVLPTCKTQKKLIKINHLLNKNIQEHTITHQEDNRDHNLVIILMLAKEKDLSACTKKSISVMVFISVNTV